MFYIIEKAITPPRNFRTHRALYIINSFPFRDSCNAIFNPVYCVPTCIYESTSYTYINCCIAFVYGTSIKDTMKLHFVQYCQFAYNVKRPSDCFLINIIVYWPMSSVCPPYCIYIALSLNQSILIRKYFIFPPYAYFMI